MKEVPVYIIRSTSELQAIPYGSSYIEECFHEDLGYPTASTGHLPCNVVQRSYKVKELKVSLSEVVPLLPEKILTREDMGSTSYGDVPIGIIKARVVAKLKKDYPAADIEHIDEEVGADGNMAVTAIGVIRYVVPNTDMFAPNIVTQILHIQEERLNTLEQRYSSTFSREWKQYETICNFNNLSLWGKLKFILTGKKLGLM